MIHRLKSSRAGFTLVELIVVIAILAILAGVAIPVYSNYIKKANEAGDLQLLSAVNTAWAAACVENGLNPTEISGHITLTGNSGAKKVGNATVTGTAAQMLSASGNSFYDSFARYFAGNDDRTFKTIDVLQYVQPQGVFVGYAMGETIMVSAMVGGQAVTFSISADDLATYNGSTFDVVGSAKLTGAIDNLTEKVYPFMGLFQSSGTLGGFSAFFEGLGLDTSGMTEDEINMAKANALVLWAASTSEDLNTEAVINALTNGAGIVNTNEAGSAKDIASMSLEYAMMMAYVHSDYATPFKISDGVSTDVLITEINGGEVPEGYSDWSEYAAAQGATYHKGKKGKPGWISYPAEPVYESAQEYFDRVSEHLNELIDNGDGTVSMNEDYSLSHLYSTITSTESWKTYMQSQGADDLAAYTSAMNIICDNVDNLGDEGIAAVLTGSYSSLNEMLQSILGT